MDENIMNIVTGLVVVAIIFVAFGAAFGTPIKYYISESNIDRLEDLGNEAVSTAKPTIVGNVWFLISSLWSIITVIFDFATGGVAAMIYDIGGMVGVSPAIIGILVGLVTLILAVKVLLILRGQ